MNLRRYAAVCVCSLVLALGCRDRKADPEPAHQQQRQARPNQVASVKAPLNAATSARFPAPERLVAIGDVHGDLQATRAALRLAGAIDASDRWIGQKLVVVQTGDQLDRGDDERQIVDLFEDLAEQALAQGGQVHALNGNHETMNVQGDFRYVTPAGLRFGAVTPVSPLSANVPHRFRERAQAFLPGGAYATLLSRRKMVLVVGDSAFAHGGIEPQHIAYGLDRINQEVSDWMRGTAPTPPAAVTSENGPVWTRLYGGAETSEVCRIARQVVEALDVRRIVVGHTVQKNGVSSICNQSLWRIDVGLAAYYGDQPVSVLEVVGQRVRALAGPRP